MLNIQINRCLTPVMLMLSIQIAYAEPRYEEIIVHSSLDKRSVEQLTASISVLESQTLQNRNAQHLDQLSTSIPSLNFSGGAARGRFAQIRGIGDIEQFVDPKAYPSVGLVVDGIELNGLFGASTLFDVEQVEVLRGPQGTRFGASSLAGAINIVSVAPTEQTTGFIEAGYGKFDSRKAAAAVGGQLSDNLLGRFSVQQFRSDGYIDNAFLNKENTGGFDEFTAKGQLAWELSTAHQLKLTLLHLDNDNGYDAFSLDNLRNTTLSDEPGDDKQRVSAAALTHTVAFEDDTRLETKITALHANTLYSYDEDWINPNFCGADTDCQNAQFSSFDQYQRNRDEYTLDIRYISNAIAAGLYTQKSDVELDRSYTFAAPFNSDYGTKRYAAYAQWTPQLSNTLNASLGARYEHFKDEYKDGALQTKTDDDLWSMDASLTLTLNESNSIYTLISRGEKPGGVNTNATSSFDLATPLAQQELTNRRRFESESLTNIELGLNSEWFNNKLSSTANIFYNKRHNPQFETFLMDFPIVAGFLFIGYQDNADSAESHGLEWQLKAYPIERLSVNANFSYIESSFKNFRVYDFDTFSYTNITEKDQPRAPSFQYHISGALLLTDELSANIEFEGKNGSQYAYYFDAESNNVSMTHVNLLYQTDVISVNFWARNVFDKKHSVQGLYFANDPRDAFAVNQLYTQAGEPRNFGVTCRYQIF
jgi:outer membrane receptor protein involved in Fe transport